MRQAIVTKYIPATDRTGSRIAATAQAGRVYSPYDDGLSTDENHRRAAIKLCDKFGWTGPLAVGGMPDGTGNVYTFVDSDTYVHNGPNGAPEDRGAARPH